MLCQALYELEVKAGEGRWSLSRVLGAPWWGLGRVGGVPVVSGDAMVVSRWCVAGVLVVPSWCLGSVSVDLGGKPQPRHETGMFIPSASALQRNEQE